MPRLTGLMFMLALTFVLSACGGGSVAETPTDTPEPPSASATADLPTVEPTLAALNPQQITEKLGPSTVMIRADFPETVLTYEGVGSGTGIVISEDGYIMTNAHVVEGASAVTIATAGSNRERPARIIGVSTCDDLAVLKVDNTEGLEPATLGKSGELKAGEEVVALGYPLGDDIGTDLTVTRGIVSKKETALDYYESLIQTDTAINPGNSGGPLINQYGEVVGINTLGFDAEVATNINFAISIDQAKGIIEQLKEGRNRQWLGMNLVPNDFADYFGVEGGMVVVAIDSGSPASRIDVLPADLLTRLEGSTINTQADVCKILRSHSDGDQLKVQLLRLTDTEQQLLEGEIAIGDPAASAQLDDLEVVQATAYDGSAPNGDQQGDSSTAGTTEELPEDVNFLDYDFSADTGEWYTNDTDGHMAAINGGTYNIMLRSLDSYFLSPADFIATENDMGIVAQVLVQGNARAGVALRYSESGDTRNYYTCWIDSVNLYGCFVSVNDRWTSLAEATPSDAILPGQVNTLVLTAVGDAIEFSINDTTVATFNDTRLTQGVPALYLENFDSEAGATFDNVTIVTPK